MDHVGKIYKNKKEVEIEDYERIIKELYDRKFTFADSSFIQKLYKNKNDIEKKLDSKIKEIQKLEGYLNRAKGDLYNLSRKNYDKEKDEYKNKIKDQQKQIENYKNENNNLKENIKLNETEFGKIKISLEKQIENYKNETEFDKIKNSKILLEKQIENYKNENNKLKENIKSYKEENIIIKNSKNDLEKQIENYINENNILKENIKSYEIEYEIIKNSINELKNDNFKLKENKKLYETENIKIKNKIKAQEKQIENYKNENNKLKESIKLNETEFGKIKNSNKELEKKIENYKFDNNNLKENVKSFEKQYNIIKNSNNELEKQIENYKNECNKLKENIKSYEIENIKMKKLKNTLEKQIEICKNDNNKLKENVKSYGIENSNIRNLNHDLKKKYDEQNNKFNGVLKEFEEMSKNRELLIKKENELKKKENENEMLKKNNEDLLKNTTTKKEFLKEGIYNFYDVILEIESINKLKKSGWKINYNENRKDVYEEIIKMETLKIGVLGLNNVGKSFILGLISGVIIPTGWSIETKGISIKYTKGEKTGDSNICLLDSAGFETPLLLEDIEEDDKHIEVNEINKNENKKNRIEDKQDEINKNISFIEKISDISKDKSQTERFIEELIISLSDMLILVVGKLTRREQNLISRIKTIVNDKEKDSINFKSVIIIHNLAQYNFINEVNNHIEQVLKKSATFKIKERKVMGIEGYQDRVFYTEEDGTDHYIMAREGSEAGKYYNNLTIEIIKRKYNDCKSRRKIDIPKEIIELFSKMSQDIIEDDISLNNIEISEDQKTLTLKNKDSNKNKDNYNYNNNYLKCQQIYTDELGNYISISSKYIPKYSYYAYKEKDKYILLISLEIPGQIEDLTASFFKLAAKKKTIRIKGSKKRDELKYNSNPILIKDNRSYDQNFNFYLELDPDIDLIKESPYQNTDVYKFEFNKKNIEAKPIKDKKEDDEMDYEEEEEDSQANDNQNNDNQNDKELIASGVYIIKFLITESSWKNIVKKYKKKGKKKNNKNDNNDKAKNEENKNN